MKRRQTINQKDVDNQRGAVLLTTLLVMTIMAVLAVMMLDQTRLSIRRSANIQLAAQADWYVQASEDFITRRINEWAGKSEDVLNMLLKSPQQITFPLEGGLITFSIRDGGQCLSVGALDEGPQRRSLRRLITNIAGPAINAEEVLAAIIDWQDADSEPAAGGAEDYTYLALMPPYRTSNVAITNLPELRAVKGMDEPLYQALRPFLCAGAGRDSLINFNTLSAAQAPILAALLGDDLENTALALINDRPSAGYENEAELRAAPALQGVDMPEANFSALGFQSRYIWVEARVSLGPIMRYAAFEFEIDNGQVRRAYRSYSPEDFRPILRSEEEQKLDNG